MIVAESVHPPCCVDPETDSSASLAVVAPVQTNIHLLKTVVDFSHLWKDAYFPVAVVVEDMKMVEKHFVLLSVVDLDVLVVMAEVLVPLRFRMGSVDSLNVHVVDILRSPCSSYCRNALVASQNEME